MTIPMIDNIYFVIIIALLTGYSTFLTTKGALTDNRNKNLWKRLTNRGKTVVFVLLTILIVLIFQELNNRSKSGFAENKLKIERSQRDSTITNGIKKGVDSSSKKLFADISNAFLKQELKLDTLNQEVTRIRDSAKIVNNFIKRGEPVIMIESDGIKFLRQNGEEREYSMILRVFGAAAANFNVLCYFVTPVKEGIVRVNKQEIFPKTLQISENGKWSRTFETYTEPHPSELYFYIIGTYTNLDGTRKYNINSLYIFDMKDNVTGVLLGEERELILKAIKDSPGNPK